MKFLSIKHKNKTLIYNSLYMKKFEYIFDSKELTIHFENETVKLDMPKSEFEWFESVVSDMGLDTQK